MATITVNNAIDEVLANGLTSLREAIANSAPGDMINFAPTLAGQTITLTLGQLLLDKNLTIDGTNQNITISGNNASRVFAIPAAINVVLNELTFTNGNGTGAVFPAGIGGAIINSGNLTVNRSNIRNSQAIFGGGIASGTGSTLVVNQSTVSGNQGATTAGGIFIGGISALISDSAIINNTSIQASAIQTQRSNTTLRNSTVSGNFSPAGGVGEPDAVLNLADLANSILTIDSSTIAFNSIAPGAVTTSSPGLYTFARPGFTATTNLINSIIANNTGGSGLQVNEGFLGNGNVITNAGGGFNLVSDNSSSIFDVTSPSNLSNTNPLLAPLGDYGGRTFTHTLLPGSPAINSGDTTLSFDQRGITRPVSFNDDRGAVETILDGNNVTVRPSFNGGTLILGSNGTNLIFGDQLTLGSPDTIAGFAGDDTIDGFAGNDSIDGGFGNDSIVGGAGSDTLIGNIGDDTLIGTKLLSLPTATDEIDVLFGGNGSDRFILGDLVSTFYSLGSGYAIIRDLEVGDLIQRGQANLIIDDPAVINPLGVGRTLSLAGNLVAVVQGGNIANLAGVIV